MTAPRPDERGPLALPEPILVVELASVLAGPAVGQFLAELGARVLKIENPRTGGDVTRSWRLDGEAKDRPSAYFASCNRGKESVALDLASAPDRAAAHRILRRADVVLTSYLPGQAERLGTDAATLRSLNPRVVVASISGYGPRTDRAGYDAVVQAETGFLHMNGQPDGPPTKMPVALVDLLAAHQLKQAILLALWRRSLTGEGGEVQVSLHDAAISSLANQGTNWLAAGHDPGRMGSEHPNIVPYGLLVTGRDGRSLLLAVGTDAQFATLCRLLDRAEWAEDERFRTNAARVRHRAVLGGLLRERIAGIDAGALGRALDDARVPAGRVRSVAEALDDVQSARLILRGPGVPGIRQAVFAAEAPDPGPAPMLGAHTDPVLAEFAD